MPGQVQSHHMMHGAELVLQVAFAPELRQAVSLQESAQLPYQVGVGSWSKPAQISRKEASKAQLLVHWIDAATKRLGGVGGVGQNHSCYSVTHKARARCHWRWRWSFKLGRRDP